MRRFRHPIRAIREPFGTAGLTVAILALVLALVGGAYAAGGGLSGKQKKEVKNIAKSYAGKEGKAGPAGPAGPQGSNGKDGTNGTNGTNGAAGAPGKSVVTGDASSECPAAGGVTVEVEGEAATKKHVCNGKTGFTETLPSGKTETGSWVFGNTPEGFIGGHILVPISFSIPLLDEMGGTNVHYIDKGEPAPDGCEGGTAAEPTADPGNLCVYSTEHTPGITTAVITKAGATTGIGASPTGAILDFFVEGEERKAWGTFAVTAE